MRVSRMLTESSHDDERPSRTGGTRHALREPRDARAGLWSLVPSRLRPKSVRAKIVALLMVPIISLMALWGFATVITAQSVSDLTRFKDVNATLLEPVDDYVTAVQAERAAATRYLAHPDPARLGALNSKASSTETAAAALRHGINANSTDTAALSPELFTRTRHLTAAADKLPALRKQVTAKKTNWDDAYAGYTATIDRGFSVDGALSGISASVTGQGQGPDVASQARVVEELSRAREMISREDAIVGSAQADKRMPAERYRSFVGAVQSQQTLFESAVDDLRPSDEAAYRGVLKSRSYEDLRSLERAIEDAGPDRANRTVSTTTWDQTTDPVLQGLHRAEAGASTAAAHKADPFAFDVLGESGIAVVLGFVGVLLSLLISMQVGRGLIVELVGMRNSALELAGSKLPRSLRRLHAGEVVDIEAEAPVRRHGGDEIGQVGSALNAVHRAAIQAAVERAEVLSGISEVYVKLARRSQVLLHRQLELLDAMERRIEDPAILEDLFRLDHLTTRMRRHAESLIILSGAAPVRGWRRPVPMLDVVRAAVAEVEDFTRVEVRVAEEVRVAGSAVADLTHLIAELVENAVAFSPPHTKVQVRGEKVGAGLALEVEDRGLGMSREALAQANRKIEDASQVDLLDTDRLGLFVVNRLAHRRDIQVALRASVYGGVTAVVLIPESQLEQETSPASSQDPGYELGAATVELPPIPGQRGGDRPHGAAAEPLPQGDTEPPGAFPTRPAFDPDRRWHARPSDHAGSPDHTEHSGRAETAPPATPVRQAPVREPVDPSRADAGPGTSPAPERTDPRRPGALPTRARTGAAAAGQGREHAPTPLQERSTRAQEHPAQAPQHRPDEPAPLPRRVRQANISPHLRDAPDQPQRSVPHIADPAATGRSPERARATMAALRAGWLSGGKADENADRNTLGSARERTGGTADQNAEEDRPPLPARKPSHSETPSQGDET
ncbi:sensor histidine kinase [Streptomyces odontomachi]|uniref:sensor histidine kinase n=1 Tax=Streptomyces odontomachi TaxID=2944940 RepID=UPI00210D762F|nr:nitrate- and nitrite sensing domain-containing protein [Streptomyces sp. ODS25]